LPIVFPPRLFQQIQVSISPAWGLFRLLQRSLTT
jgi:hypothetical protein